ncbi:MAG: biopolymer transporter ExbD [Pelagimonas sp.]|jgi:biopolymer transport protein ExbD|nr:biopolymer transporter ExbD [Pelagimonas sp.]
MTSLIDVIFLLLLFFMLSSTFTKFAEVELAAGGAAGGLAASETRPVFLQLESEALRLNGRALTLDRLQQAFDTPDPVVLVALGADVTAQRLADFLVAMRTLPAARVTVLERGA